MAQILLFGLPLILLTTVRITDATNPKILVDIFNEMDYAYRKYIRRYDSGMPSDFQEVMRPIDENSNYTKTKRFDFIIVGSGSAGAVLANRLTEQTDWSVLLLEAGKGENFFSLIPIGAPALQFTHYDWQYLMEPQPGFAMGMDGNLLAWPRGRALGGTSVINYMIYTRGNPTDYNRWTAMGNPGWSYKEVLPYFLKSENGSTLKNVDYNYHNTNGYLSIENTYTTITDVFIEGGKEMGIRNVDYNSEDNFGFSSIQSTTLKGRRHSVARAFLHPIRSRKNLHMYTSAYVTKILINPDTKRAYGVEYVLSGKKRVAYATREIILSAGTFSSAQLLMLSGIGPREHLTELGIPSLVDLPVGKKLYDHITYIGLVYQINSTRSLKVTDLVQTYNIKNYIYNGKGPYASLGGAEGIGYIKTELSEEIGDFPDIELLFIGGSASTDLGVVFRRSARIRDDIYDKFYRPTEATNTFTIFPMLVHPKSVGYMKLRSKNPFDYPLLYGNYLTDPGREDINTLIAAIRFTQRLCQTEAFQKIGCQLSPIPVPGCKLLQMNSNDYWECAIRTLSITLHHQVATAKMGPADDPEAVVAPDLKVYGVGGLRVADCSVIPRPLTAHTNAPSIMVGEKASDMIKQEWGIDIR